MIDTPYKPSYWIDYFTGRTENVSKNTAVATNDDEIAAPVDNGDISITPDAKGTTIENVPPVLHIVIDEYPGITVLGVLKVVIPGTLIVGAAISFGAMYMASYKRRARENELSKFKAHLEELNKKDIPAIIKLCEAEGLYGQEEAITDGANWIKTYARMIISALTPNSTTKHKKQNIFIFGPSGSGKTAWFKVMQKIIFKDFEHMTTYINAATDNISDSISNLTRHSNGEYGVLGVDEFGKACNKTEYSGQPVIDLTRLLSDLEDKQVMGTQSMVEELLEFFFGKNVKKSTLHMPVVLIESFSEPSRITHKTLEETIIEKVKKEKNIDVLKNNKDWVEYCEGKDLGVYFGRPDFANRFKIMKMPALTPDSYFKILTHPTEQMRGDKINIETDFNVNITIPDEVYRYISTTEAFFKRGGRDTEEALQQIWNHIRNIPEIAQRPDRYNNKVNYTITKEYIDDVIKKMNA